MASAMSSKRRSAIALSSLASVSTTSPMIQRLTGSVGLGRGDALRSRRRRSLQEARGVPQLGGEVAVALDALLIQLDVAALAFHRRHGEAQRVGAVLVDQAERIDRVALRLGHLLPVRVADQAVEVERLPRHLAHELDPLHRHPRVPEEHDVEAARSARRWGSGAARSSVCSGQPSVANGHSAEENQVSRTSSSLAQRACRRPRRCASSSVSATKTLPSSSNHAGIRWPHHSWRETHQGWMFSSQLNQVFSQVFGDDLDLARRAPPRSPAWPASRRRHTIGRSATARSPRPSGRRTGVAMTRSSTFSSAPSASSSSTTRLRASKRSRPSSSSGIRPSAVWTTRASRIEHVEHLGGLEAGALADLEIVEVVPRRDLDRARAQLRIGMLVGDDRDQPAGDRQLAPCLPTSAA